MSEVTITLLKIRETDKAIQVSETENETVWLPKSQIEYEVVKENFIEVTMPEWLYKEKGFIS